MINWSNIRAEYEHGASLRFLAAKYSVPKSTIESRAKVGNWSKPKPDMIQTSPIPLSDLPTLSETSDLSTIEKVIQLITRRLEEEPDNRDIKMLMDSLSQAYKIKLLVPAGDQEEQSLHIKKILAEATEEELHRISPDINAIIARLQAEENNITPIRKMS